MAAIRARKALLLAKAEAVEGTPETPTGGSNAVLVENISIAFNPNLVQTDEVTGSLDPRAPIPSGMACEIGFDTYIKGSGTADTPPECAALLKACGLLETITSSAVGVPTAAASGTTTTVTATAPFAATLALYNFMPLLLAVNPSFLFEIGTSTLHMAGIAPNRAAGRVATLTDLQSPALDNTTTLQVPKNVLYTPHSGTIPSLTMWVYMDGILYKFYGARGNMSLAVRSGGPGKFSFRFTGLFLSLTDAAIATPTYQSTRPPIWRDASDNGYGAMVINRVLSGVAGFGLDLGNQLTYPEDPNALEGFAPGVIVRRGINGSVDPIMPLVATNAIMADFRAATARIIHARWGSTAGNRVGITIPNAQYLNHQPGDRGGLATVGVPFFASGEDAAAMGLCFY